MRIGIDMIALQSDSRYRGIGRYAKNFLENLLEKGTEHEYILYVYDRMPNELVPTYNVQWINVWPGGPEHMTGLYNSVFGNPDKLDALLLLSPGESYVTPDVGVPRLYSIVYDLIPLLFKQKYFNDPWFEKLYYKYLSAICEYDHLFTLSESARQDILKELSKVCRGNVSVIGAAADPLFSPANEDPVMSSPFFLHIGGDDTRKGGEEVLRAFAKLPNRKELELVYSYGGSDYYKGQLFKLAESLGVAENFIFRGYSSDDYIRKLYSQCLAFIFPSEYEGFGLPILEAMSCGASVVAGNNSAQVEIVKDFGIVTDPKNIEALSNIMYILSVDKDLNNYIKGQCLERSKDFSWDKVIGKFLETIVRPRLAIFSPIPPTPSGISDYIVSLLPHLAKTFDITIYVEGADDKKSPNDCDNKCEKVDGKYDGYYRVLPHTSFKESKHDYILYQMGNSEYHRYMYPYMMKYPGVVTLHDFCLAGFHNNYDWVYPGHYKEQVDLSGAQYDDYDKEIERSPKGRVIELVDRGINLNDGIMMASKAIITHSQAFADNKFIHHTPFPKEVVPQAIKSGWAPTLNIVAPGWLSETKLNLLCLQAFSQIDYKGAHLVFAGAGDSDYLKKFAEENNIAHRVKFTGRLTKEEYADIIREADVGVILRREPTHGETSAALFDLLAAGVPTLVSNVGTFREIPDNAVAKIDEESAALVADTLNVLLKNKEMRKMVGRAGRDYVEKHHNPAVTAKIYTKIIKGEF